MNTSSPKNMKSRQVRRAAIGIVLLIVTGFVIYNVYSSRDIETVDQTDNSSTPAEQTPPTDTTPEAPVERTGSFSSLNGYSVSGQVTLTESGSERRLVFSEDFASSAGPDVLVYLTKNDTAAEGGSLVEPVSLGAIKSFNGEQSYVLPENSDEYSSVVIWCRAFSSAFGAASL